MESQKQYPPVSHNQMPQWARVGQLDKSRYPKAFSKDHFGQAIGDDSDTDNMSDSDRIEDENPAMRIEYLERSIQFLKGQHQDVLASLHAEIEKLRNDNKELHFKMVMSKGSSLADAENYETETLDQVAQIGSEAENALIDSYLKEKTQNQDGAAGGATNHILEQQIVELRHQVRELKNKNLYLAQIVEQRQQNPTISNKDKSVYDQNQHPSQSSASISEISINMEGVASVPHLSRSIVVQDRTGSARRRPNETDLHKIVVHLHRTNQQLQKELAKVKSDLKEVLYSHKWTPDAYLLARAYVADGTQPATDVLPKLPLQSTTRKLPDIAYIRHDNISLPALKNTMGTKAAERKKRTQILQKARLHHKEVL